MFAVRLSTEVFFSHSTAARLHGVPLPPRFERMTRLHVTIPAPGRAPHAQGLLGHSRFVAPSDIVGAADGIRLSSPARTFCEMGSVLALPDLVAVADHLIRRDAPLCSVAELLERLNVGDRITRRSLLREAIRLARPRSESRPESVLRLILLRCGWGEPEANLEVRGLDGRSMRIDLAFPQHNLAIEYHGDYHRTPEQWRRDLARRSRLEALGWTVVELTADDLRDPDELVARITAIAARARLIARIG
ncbi:MAG TPA: DUF559 domain-containing protein [Pseudolysinimonas sp.]|nr:DUF559 domain-containing protein [Pseudolysinimonas sp.]